jgi:UDP-3-O-[3-hydroxymyristoyl] glucosamine N-acyltransferase
MKKTLREIAELVGGRVAGDSSIEISGATNIVDAGKHDLTFAVDPHIEEAAGCSAGAVLLPDTVSDFPLPAIYVQEPRVAFAKLLELFTPPLQMHEGVSSQAYVGKNVKLGEHVTLMPFAVVDDYAEIGAHAILYPHTYVGQYAIIGEASILYSNVTVRERCQVGRRVIIHSSTVVGADGFGFTTQDGIHTKVPQVGNVVLEDDVELGAHVGIDRATTGSTVIGHGTKIDNLVHIGHNCHVGAHNLIVAQTGISGSTVVGDNVTFGGQVGTVGHIHIGGHSVFAARSGLTNDTPEGVFYAGFPARPHQEWLRMEAVLKHLPELSRRIRQLEKKLEQYEGRK